MDAVHTIAVSREAMACCFEAIFNIVDNDVATAWGVEALDLIEAIEDQITIYRPTSELSVLNRRAASGWQPVSPELFQLLILARDLHERTAGGFDVTSGPLVKAWGFVERRGRTPSPADLAAARSCCGMDKLEFDEAKRRIRFQKPGVEINLGGIGKGWAIDQAIDLIGRGGGVNVLLHGGQSSVRARGTQGVPAATTTPGWPVGLRHPLRPRERLGQIMLDNQALGTSGSGTQFFIERGRKLGHILDPRSGQPAKGVLSATVLAPTAAEADALATAAYVLGPAGLPRIAPPAGSVSAVLVLPGKRAEELTVVLANLAENQFQLNENLRGLTIVQAENDETESTATPQAEPPFCHD